MLMETFDSVNKVIKSISDIAFGNYKDNKIKEEALFKIFGNQYACLEWSLRKWQENNQILKVKRDKIKRIQTGFLTKMMKQKIGMIMTAIQKWKNLPDKIDKNKNEKASKF